MGNIRSKPYITKESRDNFDRIFRKKEKMALGYGRKCNKCKRFIQMPIEIYKLSGKIFTCDDCLENF